MSKIMHLNKLGDFRLQRVLVQYDAPFIFTCLNERNKLMLFVENDYNDESESWVSIFITEEILYNLLSGNKSIQETFINCDVHTYYLISHDFATDVYSYKKEKSFPAEILSDGRDYINFSNEEEQAELIKSLNSTYEETLMPVMDFHFNKYTNSHSLPIEFLVTVLQNVKKIYNGIIRVKAHSLEVQPCYGSLVLRFKSVIPDSTIETNSSAYAFETIENILSSDDPEKVKNVLLENPRIINPLKTLYSTLAKRNRDFEVATISDKKKPDSYQTIYSKNVSLFYEQLKNKKLKETLDITKKGVMEGFDNVKGTFSFIPIGEKVIKGKISKDINENNPKIKDNFQVIFEETTELDLENGRDHKTYVLKHIEHLI